MVIKTRLTQFHSKIWITFSWVFLFVDKKRMEGGVVDGIWRDEERIQRLRCTVKNYDWGKYNPNAEVYRLYIANCGDKEKVNNNGIKTYAEFWMGTHDSGPSYVVRNDRVLVETLKLWIQNHPFVLGDKVLNKWGCHLPFLFKVLSVAKLLSIQAHPCKPLAEKLHLKYPEVYKDGNHKPEMVLAITKFDILCGFVAIQDLQKNLRSVPEISQLVGSGVVERVTNINPKDGEESVKDALRHLFTQIMIANDHVITKVLSNLINRLRKKDKLTAEEKLALWLEEKYPGDVGVLAAFFMNLVTLNPGEAVCMGENELHVYLLGDCIECMATSDNVVRAGLTSKQRDVKTLCEMLTYKQGRPEVLRGFNVEGTDGSTTRYRPPYEEFEVDHCVLSERKTISFSSVASPSLFLVTQGTGTIRAGFSVERIGIGDILFSPVDSKVTISSDSRL